MVRILGLMLNPLLKRRGKTMLLVLRRRR